MEGSVALARSNLGRLLLADLEESLLCIPRRESGDCDAMVKLVALCVLEDAKQSWGAFVG